MAEGSESALCKEGEEGGRVIGESRACILHGKGVSHPASVMQCVVESLNVGRKALQKGKNNRKLEIRGEG